MIKNITIQEFQRTIMETINTNKMANMLGVTDNVYKHLSKEEVEEEFKDLSVLLERAKKEGNDSAIKHIEEELELISEVL